MIDIKFVRLNKDLFKKKISLKDPHFDSERLFFLDQQRLEMQKEIDELLQKKKIFAKKGGDLSSSEQDEAIKIKESIEKKKVELEKTESEYEAVLLSCPNIPDDNLPVGNKDFNREIFSWGNKKDFKNYIPKEHVDLICKESKKKCIDFLKGSSLSGSGFILYEDKIVEIIRELTDLFLMNNRSFGFKEIIVPHIITKNTMTNASNLPRFKEDLYKIENENLYLIPTAEVSIASLHEKQLLDKKDLPLRYTAKSQCFRKEAGGYGKSERGIIRIHEFEKCELFTFSTESEENAEFELMLRCAKNILELLHLPYRIMLLATGDCSFASKKTCDIEVWLDGRGEYREVSSVSMCGDFQSRRSESKYKDGSKDERKFLRTLNGSSLAVPRTLIALLEKHQLEDGSVETNEIINLIKSAKRSIIPGEK